jgi:hypothetical protein
MWWFKMIGVRVRSVGEGREGAFGECRQARKLYPRPSHVVAWRNYRIYSARHK